MVAVIAVTTDRKGERGRIMVAVMAVTTYRQERRRGWRGGRGRGEVGKDGSGVDHLRVNARRLL